MKLSLHELYLIAANLPDPETLSIKAGRRSYERLLVRLGREIRKEEDAESRQAPVLTGNLLLDLYQKAIRRSN